MHVSMQALPPLLLLCLLVLQWPCATAGTLVPGQHARAFCVRTLRPERFCWAPGGDPVVLVAFRQEDAFSVRMFTPPSIRVCAACRTH